MASDEPPYLTVGTEVSARYKGAFCEAKVKKVNRQVKCRVNFKNSLGSSVFSCDSIKGNLRLGATVEAKHLDTGQFHEAVITKLNDYSQYTVVFDDGDVTTLRRTSLCLKSGKHFAESETLDQLPLTNPEHFGTPVVNIKTKRKRRPIYTQDDSSDEGPSASKMKKEFSPAKNKYHLKELEADLGRIVCVDYGDKRKKDSWFPGLIVSPAVQDNVTINQKEDFLIRSFKDGKYYTVCKKDARPFKKEIASKVDGPQLKAVEKAIQFMESSELPTHWDKDALLNVDIDEEDFSDTDSDSSNDEPTEDEDRFIAQLYNFMDERSTPINKAPCIGSKDLNLYKLFNTVQKLGGYNRVTNQSKWKIVYMKMGLQSLISNGTILIKQAYKKYLLGFEEIHKKLGYTMVGKESTRSGRSSRNVRPPVKSSVKRKLKVEEAEKEVTTDSENSRKSSNLSSTDEQPDIEVRRTPRGKIKEEKEEILPAKKMKAEPVQKKETRNTPLVKNDKAKEDKEKTPCRNRQKKEESDKSVEQKTPEPQKRVGRKKSTVELPSRQSEDNDSSNDHVKSGPVEVGDKVRVKYGFGEHREFYDAKVREVRKEEKAKSFLVHYAGWNTRHDEWVDSRNIEYVIEKCDGKPQNIKIKNSQSSKTGDGPKINKRGRTVSERSITLAPAKVSSSSKLKPANEPLSSTSTKASTSKINSPSPRPASNRKSPSRNISATASVFSAKEDSTVQRNSRSTRSEKKMPVKSGSTPPISEIRRRSHKISGVFPQSEMSFNVDSVDSSSDNEERSSLKHEAIVKTRRKKEAERAGSLEPTKKLCTRRSTSKKKEKSGEDSDNDGSCADGELKPNKLHQKVTSPIHPDSDEEAPTIIMVEPKSDDALPLSENDVKVTESESAGLPVKKEGIPSSSAKESNVEDVMKPDSRKSNKEHAVSPEPSKLAVAKELVETKSSLALPVLEAQDLKPDIKTESPDVEELKSMPAATPFTKSNDDVDRLPEGSESAETTMNPAAKIVKRKRILKKKVSKTESPSSSEREEAEPKQETIKVEKIECNKEVLKVEGAAIVEDAFRKMAASLGKVIMKEPLRAALDVTVVAKSEGINVDSKKEISETVKSAEPQFSSVVPTTETKTNVESKDNKPTQNTDTVSEPDVAEIESHSDASVDENCEIMLCSPVAEKDAEDEVADLTEICKVNKKKLKDKNPKDSKGRKAKKKPKLKEDESTPRDDESADSEKGKKKDKKKKVNDVTSGSENLSVLADVTINSPMKKEKKSKKLKDKSPEGDEGEKRGKNRQDPESDDEEEKVHKLKKMHQVNSPVGNEASPFEILESKDLGANISLLCDEDVLPASPIPASEDKVIVPEIYHPHSSRASLAALAPALAAELQQSPTLTINTTINSITSNPVSHDQYAFSPAPISQVKQYETLSEAPQLLADNTPPTTPEGSITTNSVISSPCHDHEVLEGSSSCQEVSGSTSPRSAPDSSTADHESREDDRASQDLTEVSEKDGVKRKRKNSRRSRNISESSRSSIKLKSSAAKDTDTGTDSSDARDKHVEPTFSYTHLPPKSSKFNFYVPLDEYTDGAKRIELIQEKMTELRKTYMSLKSELAQIDRRRKKARRKEREAAAVENQVVTNPVQCS